MINNGSIDFFFNKDYKEDLQNMANPDKVLGVIDTLREPVSQLSNNSKDMAMKYIQNLSKLSSMYYT